MGNNQNELCNKGVIWCQARMINDKKAVNVHSKTKSFSHGLSDVSDVKWTVRGLRRSRFGVKTRKIAFLLGYVCDDWTVCSLKVIFHTIFSDVRTNSEEPLSRRPKNMFISARQVCEPYIDPDFKQCGKRHRWNIPFSKSSTTSHEPLTPRTY